MAAEESEAFWLGIRSCGRDDVLRGVEEGETIRTDVAFLYFLIIFLPLFFFAECDVR